MKITDGIIPHTDEWEQSRLGKITSSHLNKIFVNGRSKDKLIGEGGLTYVDKKIGEMLSHIISDQVPETDRKSVV